MMASGRKGVKTTFYAEIIGGLDFFWEKTFLVLNT